MKISDGGSSEGVAVHSHARLSDIHNPICMQCTAQNAILWDNDNH